MFSGASVHIFGVLYHCAVNCDQDVFESFLEENANSSFFGLNCENNGTVLCPNCDESTNDRDWCQIDQSSGSFDHIFM